MSVIFETLQKLGPSEEGHPSLTTPVAAPDITENIKPRLPMRMLVISIVVVVIIALGFGAVYGVRQLADRLQPDPTSSTDKPRYAMPQSPTVTQPLGPSTQPADRTLPMAARYFPPEAPKFHGPPAFASVTAPAAPLPATPPIEPTARISGPQGNTEIATLVLPSKMTAAAPEGNPTADTFEADNAAAPDPLEAHGDREKAWQMAEVARLAAMQKSARIGRLVDRIEASLLEPDSGKNQEKTKALLDELSHIKGADSEYVIKLNAFQFMKTGQYKHAERLLNKIVSANGDDPEAGLNLAVIEINTGRTDQARARLRKLRDLYPENMAFTDLLRKVK